MKKNKDFIPLKRKTIDIIIELANQNPKAFELFMIIVKYMNEYNEVGISNAALCERMQCSKSTVVRAIKSLKEWNFIYVYKEGTSNVYVINSNIFWASQADPKLYCKFSADVTIPLTKNYDYLDNYKAVNYLNVYR